jgi:hypothetical protein
MREDSRRRYQGFESGRRLEEIVEIQHHVFLIAVKSDHALAAPEVGTGEAGALHLRLQIVGREIRANKRLPQATPTLPKNPVPGVNINP